MPSMDGWMETGTASLKSGRIRSRMSYSYLVAAQWMTIFSTAPNKKEVTLFIFMLTVGAASFFLRRLSSSKSGASKFFSFRSLFFNNIFLDYVVPCRKFVGCLDHEA